jgi:hypothetical protein
MSYNALPEILHAADMTPTGWNTYIRDNFEASVPAIYTTKGDLPVNYGTLARFPAGTNGQILCSTVAEIFEWSWGFVPIGGIIMWSGALAGLPANWALCNGASGTPDLRNKFIIGAGGAYAVGASGGANTLNLAHTHLGAASGAGGSHTHSQAATGASSHAHSGGDTSHVSPSGSTGGSSGVIFGEHWHVWSAAAETAHTHDNANTDAATHTHAITTGSSLSATQDMRPPFYQLAYIMRLS